MSQVLKLRSERAQLNDELQALAKLDATETLNEEQLTRFTELEGQITALTDRIARAEVAERAAAASAVPVEEGAQGIQSPPGTIEGPHSPKPVAGAKVAQMVRLLAATQGNQQMAAQMAKEGGFGADVAMALNTVTPGAGGVLVPENFSTELIELLRPKSVVRAMGCRTLPLNNGNLTLPRIRKGTTVQYIGADTDIPVTGMEFADLKLSAKTLAAIVPIANDLIAYAGVSPRVDEHVVLDLTESTSLAEDLHFLRSPGSDVLPKGTRFWAHPGNLVPAPLKDDLQSVEFFLSAILLRLEGANAHMASPGWVMAPRTRRWLASLRDGNGNKVYPELDQKMLKGYPVGITTQIPINLGDKGEESEIHFVDFGDCYIGEGDGLVINFSSEATYKNADGEVVSAFQRNQTLIRVIAKHDFGPRHIESVAIGTGVRWGVEL
ncbi:phage major capsid protein [Pseudomonas tohonis]|uniref:phage major capsid protein n=1 Tax=Pseudomonas sp. zfem005 TaxID=3078200 RepID=UPI000396E6A9|nr:phage major capsid protein [Pseudomonas sp. zfem005]EQM72023.1 gp6, major capsid head protein [Pseudomonas alcaligenes OT 69]MDN4145976.1 phage major capsid protein [Pseudomonas tohonis]MDU9415310.1 phage major capsid protein [Pseudomonas sp. zfem005]